MRFAVDDDVRGREKESVGKAACHGESEKPGSKRLSVHFSSSGGQTGARWQAMNVRRLMGGCLLAVVPMTSGFTMERVWKEIEWRGEPAWESAASGWRAVVSAGRARLVHFGPVDSGHNLLHEVEVAEPFREGGPFPDWGGHRFWLGPQKSWEWPPHPDWEYSAAADIRILEDRLVVVMRDSDGLHPGLVREYFWLAGRLGCRVSWSDTDRPYYAMHVFAVPATTRVRVRPIPTVDVPLGFVRVTWDFPERPGSLPPGAETGPDGRLVLRPAATASKLGFPPQELEGDSEVGRLVISPAVTTGRVIHPPDAGFLTQAWICPEGGAFIELEQISPYLLPENGPASSLVFLDGIGPGAPP